MGARVAERLAAMRHWVTLTLNPASIAESGAGNVATVTARLSHPTTVATTAVLPAMSGDFTRTGNTLTIAAGSTASTGTVTLTTPPSAAVRMSVTRWDADGLLKDESEGRVAPSSLTFTTGNWEMAQTVTLVLEPSSISEDGEVSTVTATLSHPSSAATAGDFTLSSANTLTIAAGGTTSTGTVTITAEDNAVDAADKTVTVSGTAENDGPASDGMGAVASATLTIADEDEKGFLCSTRRRWLWRRGVRPPGR